jgi:hypothetical protein
MQRRVTGLGLGLLLNAVTGVPSCTPQRPAARVAGGMVDSAGTAPGPALAAQVPAVRINQLGYLPERAKINWNAAMTWAAARLDEEGDK